MPVGKLNIMDKALKLGKTSAAGGFQLFMGKTLSTIILAVGTIVLGIFILPSDYGLYAVALIPASTVLLFQDWGVGSALVKYCAQYRAMGRESELRRIILAGLAFEACTGLLLTVFSLAASSIVAGMVFAKPEAAFLIAIASVSVLASALLVGAQSVFVGFERMSLASIAMLCQAATQAVLSPLLVYMGYGALGAVIGYTAASAVTGAVAVALLYTGIVRKLPCSRADGVSMRRTLAPLLKYGVPLAVASILSGALTQYAQFVMGSAVDLASIGNYRIASNFAVLLTFFTIPISTVLFPAFSKINPEDEPQLLKTVFASSAKYTALFLVPATVAMMTLAHPLIATIYGEKYPYAPLYLALGVAGNLFALLGSLSMSSLLTGLGETKLLMKLNLLTLAIGIPASTILIPTLGIIGLIIAVTLAGAPSLLFGLRWVSRRYSAKAELTYSAKVFLASATAAIPAYTLVQYSRLAVWVQLFTGAGSFLLVYLIVAPLVGALTKSDIRNLRAMFSSLGIISKLINLPLVLSEKIAYFTANYPRAKPQA
jgi:stage V sporulation protein B